MEIAHGYGFLAIWVIIIQIIDYIMLLSLNHCSGVVTPYGNIDMDNGLVPNGTQPLPEPMMTQHQWGLVAVR